MGCGPIHDPSQEIITQVEAHQAALLAEFNVIIFDPTDPNLCHSRVKHGGDLDPQFVHDRVTDPNHPFFNHNLPVDKQFSSAFYSNEIEFFCREIFLEQHIDRMNAFRDWAISVDPDARVYFNQLMEFNEPVGYGFAGSNPEFEARDLTVVMFVYVYENNVWKEVTAFPDVQQKQDQIFVSKEF